MDPIKDQEVCTGLDKQEQLDVANIFRHIFCSCDVDNADMVPVSKLIEYIKPFMMKDLIALEDLRHALDPEGTDTLVNSELFYEVIGEWSHKMAAESDEETEFNRSPSRLTVIDDKDLPFHSTPRPSLGDTLLKCKDLLNISNVSGYSLSTSRLDTTNPADSDKTVLEEEIKKLDHQLTKTTDELINTKQLLTASEEQIESFQKDLERLNRRLQAEQKVNEHLQNEKKMGEDIREELNQYKNLVEELKKKLSQSEKESLYHKDLSSKLDEEKIKLENKITVLAAQHQECLKTNFEYKTELETKEQLMTEMSEKLRAKILEQTELINQLREANDILHHQKSILEAARAKSCSSRHSSLGNLNFPSTPSPTHTQNYYSPVNSNPNPSYQNGVNPKSRPLIQKVLARNSSTPVSLTHSLLDTSIPANVKGQSILSPIQVTKWENDQRHDSSEEDLSWKLQQGNTRIEEQNPNWNTDSLQKEMCMAESVPVSPSYSTFQFEEDERETLKACLKEVEDERNELFARYEEQKKINSDLVEENFRLNSKYDSTQNKHKSLKNRIAQLERNGIIVENNSVSSEDSQSDDKTLEKLIENKETEILDLKSNITSINKELIELKERLSKADESVVGYDERLQQVMKELGSVSAEKRAFEEKVEELRHDKQYLVDKNKTLNEKLQELKNELLKLAEEKTALSDRNKALEENEFILKHDLEDVISKYNHLKKKFAVVEEEMRSLRDLNNNKDQEITRCREEQTKIVNKFEEQLMLKEKELKHLLNIQKQKDDELELFKENLENKIVKEFEGKVKYSVDAEEKIMHLTQTCKQQEQDLKMSLSKLSAKSRCLIEAENKIKYLNEIEASLQKDINDLKSSESELEATIANLKMEKEDFFVKLQKVDKIDSVASEIQKYIDEKNGIINELKVLNKKMESNLYEAQNDLRKKNDDILKLRSEWAKNVDIKNDLWNRVKTLEKENCKLNLKDNELSEKHQELVTAMEELQIEYSNLLITYDSEVNKNYELSKEITQIMEEKDQHIEKYNDLKTEYDTVIAKLSAVELKIQENSQLMSESQSKFHDMESKCKELQETITKCQDDDMSQKGVDCEMFEDLLSEIKIEPEKILEELESRLNEEINKNRNLTNDLLKMEKHLNESNSELLQMRQRITNNESDMMAKLQQSIESNTKMAAEVSQFEATLHTKNIELCKLVNRLKETEEKLKVLKENNSIQNQELSLKCAELEEIKALMKDSEERIKAEIGGKIEQEKKLIEVQNLLKQCQEKIRELESENAQLQTELDSTKKEKDEINRKLMDTTFKVDLLEENILKLQQKHKISEEEKRLKIMEIENTNRQLQLELNLTKEDKEKLNNDLRVAAVELNQFKENENSRNKLLNETKQKLQEEISKNIAVFKNFNLLKKERDRLSNELSDTESNLLDTTTLLNKNQIELKALRLKNMELESQIQDNWEQLNKSQNLLKKTQEKVEMINLEKNLIETELSEMKTTSDRVNLELKDMEISLSETKQRLDIKCLDNDRLTLELEEVKRKLSENFNSDGSSCSITEKETSKRRTYSRQQITIDKLKEKLEDMGNKLKLLSNENQQLKSQLSLSESEILGHEDGLRDKIQALGKKEKESIWRSLERNNSEHKLDISVLNKKSNQSDKNLEAENVNVEINKQNNNCSQEEKSSNSDRGLACETKTVNKFTLASRPASPDSQTENKVNELNSSMKFSLYPQNNNFDSIIDIPSLDINGCADDIIDNLELKDGSPRKQLDKEEIEEKVTALTLRLLVSCNSITERIETQTERYRCKYEDVLSIIRDISNRLRDHVCIGTAEPIMPVFVLLEDIKLQLKELVQTTGQVGVLIYEDRMKKCWNLVTNYMAMLRKENETLHSIPRETTPTQTGIKRRRNKSTQEKVDLAEKNPQTRRRLFPCTRLLAILLFVLAFALTISLVVHLNCRMATSENQYCPLDGIITRINIGIPPM